VSSLLDASPSIAPGAKFHCWDRRGVPLRLEVGQAEVTAGTVTIAVNPGLVVPLLVGLSAHDTSGSSSSRGFHELLEQYAHGWQQQVQQLQHTAAAAAANKQATTALKNHPGVPLAAAAAATAASSCTAGTPWGGNAVAAAGVSPLKLAAVPAAEAAAVCKQLLQAIADAVVLSADVSEQHQATPGYHITQQQQQQSANLLPYGCCSKLHLWPDLAAADRPCLNHLQYLVGAVTRPCHCGAGCHVSLQELQGELQHQLQEFHSGNLSSTVKFAAESSASAGKRRSRNVTTGPSAGDSSAAAAGGTASLFVSGLPTNRPAAVVRQQLLQQLSGLGVLAVTVPAVGQGRRCRVWAKLLLADESSAAALLQQTDGRLVSMPACLRSAVQ
jgi:hypothetical protein